MVEEAKVNRCDSRFAETLLSIHLPWRSMVYEVHVSVILGPGIHTCYICTTGFDTMRHQEGNEMSLHASRAKPAAMLNG